ncbi:Vitamin B12-dependent ribonucleoside-diphosphate reductase [Candidatus Burarchaeum australiense]|nr:Vitamin B12-dependent ribonucleoside-diphosphate reductase [Candidatus Burarchaeum australiense]
MPFSYNALKVLEKRYLRRDSSGEVIETPRQMFARVARNIAKADAKYGETRSGLSRTANDFFSLLWSLDFLPNSPTLMNAGAELQQLSACFVLPVEDSMESIFTSLKHTAMIQQSGGGTGFSFSRLRPSGDIVRSTSGISSGPVSFMKAFNMTTEVVKQGGKRRGANMGILRYDHPDIEAFVRSKESGTELTNFNISVAVSDYFMGAVKHNSSFPLINPRTGAPQASMKARHLFNLIAHNAWLNGDPGLIFLDRINRDNPTPRLGHFEATNPCGEIPLLPYEACNLGSINLAHMVRAKKGGHEFDWARFRRTIHAGVHFLDNVIDMSAFPVPEIDRAVKRTRKIGLGIMGFADCLVLLGIRYDAAEALAFGEKIAQTMAESSFAASRQLAEERGTFEAWYDSIYGPKGRDVRMRNATRTTIAPTGTLSILANCSSGIEPIFAVSYVRHVLEGAQLIEVNPIFEQLARKQGFYSEKLMRKIASTGTVGSLREVPKEVRELFVTARELRPEMHVRMQASFQRYIDNAVSKTVNFPANATERDVQKAYLLAHELGCKGITIYRDSSREGQVLSVQGQPHSKTPIEAESSPPRSCPTC